MVKWALAAVPAIIIPIIIWTVISISLNALFGGGPGWQWGPGRVLQLPADGVRFAGFFRGACFWRPNNIIIR